jgi:hypothetical protein
MTVPLSGQREIRIDGTRPAPLVVAADLVEPARTLVLARSTLRSAIHPVRVVIVVETSAAMRPKMRRAQGAAIERLLKGLPNDAAIRVLAADWRTTEVARSDSSRTVDAVSILRRLDAIRSAGALDLEQALSTAIELAEREALDGVVLFRGGSDAFGRDLFRGPLARLAHAGVQLFTVDLTGTLRRDWLAGAARTSGGLAVGNVDASTIARSLRVHAMMGPPAVAGVYSWHPLETIAQETVWLGRTVVPLPASAVRVDARSLEPLWGAPALDPWLSDDRDPVPRHQVLEPAKWITGYGMHRPCETAAVFKASNLVEIESGSLSKAEIGQVLRRAALLPGCAARSGTTAPFGERAELHLTIAPTGEVADVLLHGDALSDTSIERCVVERARLLRFPKARRGDIARARVDLAVSYEAPPFLDLAAGDLHDPSIEKLAGLMSAVRENRFDKRVVTEIARILEAPTDLPRVSLAWWIVEHLLRAPDAESATQLNGHGIVTSPWYSGWVAHVVSASLLQVSHEERDAVRVLSELAPVRPLAVERTMRDLGFVESALRLGTLSPRCW